MDVYNLCDTVRDSIYVEQMIVASVSLGEDTVICYFDSIEFVVTGNPYDSFSWHNDSTYTSFMTKDEGVYWVMMTNRCSADTDSVRLSVIPDIITDIGNDSLICPNDTIVSKPGPPLYEGGVSSFRYTPRQWMGQVLQASCLSHHLPPIISVSCLSFDQMPHWFQFIIGVIPVLPICLINPGVPHVDITR